MEYVEFRKRGAENSGVWLHFLRATDHKTAKCKICKKIFKAEGGSTSALRNHLKSVHTITLEAVGTSTKSQPSENQDHRPSGKKTKIDDYFTKETSMDWMVSRMVCLDGIPFRVFANSADLRRLFKNYGHQLPSSANTIRNIVFKKSESVKQEIIAELEKLKHTGIKFSVTMDEWTSTANKRYINVNIHSPSINNSRGFHNIGLIRIEGSATALKCIQLLNDRLEAFHLNTGDIVGLSTDAASVMIRLGRNMPVYHQLCYAHGLQLAILDVLYKSQPIIQEQSLEEDYCSESEITEDIDSECENDESFIVETQRRRVVITNLSCKLVIDKVRKVCKLFRKSPTKNDEALQKHVKQTFNKELNLILDCKTRWSSLALMLERFIMLFSCVQKALIDIKSEISFDAEELNLMQHIHSILDIFKGSLELLCENDATLLTADFVLKFILAKLEETPGPLTAAFQTALKKRIRERYLLVQSVLKYLDNPDEFYSDHQFDNIFVHPTTDDMVSIILSLLTTATGNDSIDNASLRNQPSTSSLSEPLTAETATDETSEMQSTTSGDLKIIEPLPSTSKSSIKDVLRREMKKKVMVSRENRETTRFQEGLCSNAIRFEVALHDNGGNRGRFLEMAFKLLSSIKPTSVECERTFSTAGYLCSRFRSRMNDGTLNSLIVLKYYLLSMQR